MKTSRKLIAAACAAAAMAMGGAALAADSHTITVNAVVNGNCKFNTGTSSIDLTVDPTAASPVTGNASVLYRCTKGTTPVFALNSGSTGSSAGGNLGNGTETIPYTFTSSGAVPGSGMGPGQDKTLSVTVSVNPADADVAPDTYTDTIAITLTP